MSKKKIVLGYSLGSLAMEVDSGNDAYCPTRHPIIRKEEITVWALTNYHEPTEFYFTSEAVGYLNQCGMTISKNKWQRIIR